MAGCTIVYMIYCDLHEQIKGTAHTFTSAMCCMANKERSVQDIHMYWTGIVPAAYAGKLGLKTSMPEHRMRAFTSTYVCRNSEAGALYLHYVRTRVATHS